MTYAAQGNKLNLVVTAAVFVTSTCCTSVSAPPAIETTNFLHGQKNFSDILYPLIAQSQNWTLGSHKVMLMHSLANLVQSTTLLLRVVVKNIIIISLMRNCYVWVSVSPQSLTVYSPL